MNRKIGLHSARVNAAAVLAFAVCMLADASFGCCFASMFIALMCAFAHDAPPERQTAGYAAVAFAAVYAAIILLVYFAQLTAVRGCCDTTGWDSVRWERLL